MNKISEKSICKNEEVYNKMKEEDTPFLLKSAKNHFNSRKQVKHEYAMRRK